MEDEVVAVVKASLTTGIKGEIVINPERFRELMAQRGWKNYPQVAAVFGVTRQRIQQIMVGFPVSAEFIATLAIVTGSDVDKTYTYYFEIRKVPFPDNHPRWNQAKLKGERPYEKFSHSANLRENDFPVEKKERIEYPKGDPRREEKS